MLFIPWTYSYSSIMVNVDIDLGITSILLYYQNIINITCVTKKNNNELLIVI